MIRYQLVCKCTLGKAEIRQGILKKYTGWYFEIQRKSIYFTLLITETSISAIELLTLHLWSVSLTCQNCIIIQSYPIYS